MGAETVRTIGIVRARCKIGLRLSKGWNDLAAP
jgi:hypothetical protein